MSKTLKGSWWFKPSAPVGLHVALEKDGDQGFIMCSDTRALTLLVTATGGGWLDLHAQYSNGECLVETYDLQAFTPVDAPPWWERHEARFLGYLGVEPHVAQHPDDATSLIVYLRPWLQRRYGITGLSLEMAAELGKLVRRFNGRRLESRTIIELQGEIAAYLEAKKEAGALPARRAES